MLFPEGTRFTAEKHQASQKFARDKGLPELKHHLSPRTKGFIASLPSMEGKIDAVYDIVLSFKPEEQVKPTMTNLLYGKKVTAYFYMKRIPMADVPKDEENASKFLQEMFVRKVKSHSNIFFLKLIKFFIFSPKIPNHILVKIYCEYLKYSFLTLQCPHLTCTMCNIFAKVNVCTRIIFHK